MGDGFSITNQFETKKDIPNDDNKGRSSNDIRLSFNSLTKKDSMNTSSMNTSSMNTSSMNTSSMNTSSMNSSSMNSSSMNSSSISVQEDDKYVNEDDSSITNLGDGDNYSVNLSDLEQWHPYLENFQLYGLLPPIPWIQRYGM